MNVDEISAKERDAKSILASGDVERLKSSDGDVWDYFFVSWVYDNAVKAGLSAMNHTQRVAYLSMRLDDVCQADGIRSLSEDEELFFNLGEVCMALDEIRAVKTARYLGEFIRLLPENTFSKKIIPEWEWFWAKERADAIDEIDTAISARPDGRITERLRTYLLAENRVTELFSKI